MAQLKDTIVLGDLSVTSTIYGNHIGNTTGNLTGNADIATKVGNGTVYLYAENNDEINIGGSNTGASIYIGHRAKDSRPKPTNYYFGGTAADATVRAATFIGKNISMTDSWAVNTQKNLLSNTVAQSSGFVWMLNCLAPNTTGGDQCIIIGKANSAYNAGTLSYHFGSSGSNTANYISLGLYGSDHLLNVRGDGYVGIGTVSPGYKLDVNGTFGCNGHSLFSTGTAGNNAYYDGSAIQIREVGQVGNAQSAWTYAPKIGFHWANRYQGTFGLHSNGAYYLSLSAGQGNATLYAGAVYGGVWNDYAEYRQAETTEPGRCVKESPTGIMELTTKRMEKGCEIISDTFGFAIGETNECKTPIAATGRVLAYTDRPREEFELGMPVCSGPNGTVSQMTEEEARQYPWCIIGTVSEIPTYEEWGTGNVKVNNRIWIRIR